MYRISVIGIGTGNPQHMTVQGIEALNKASVVLLPLKGEAKEDLADLRRSVCAQYLRENETRIIPFDLPLRDSTSSSYDKGVADWHDEIARLYAELLMKHVDAQGSVALLIWGDPSLYDSTLRILDRLQQTLELDIEVIPGITSVQALAAGFKMPLNSVGGPIHITTGRRLRSEGVPLNCDTVVVMLDGQCTFLTLDGSAFDIYWGAYLGSPDEILMTGRLEDVREEIVRERKRLREAKGWIMDTYLLRRKKED